MDVQGWGCSLSRSCPVEWNHVLAGIKGTKLASSSFLPWWPWVYWMGINFLGAGGC